MNKIIQFLRLSRLVLLVILLLFAVIAKIARAETAELWTTLQCTADVKFSQKSFGSPQAVVDQCFPGSYLGPRDPERGYHQVFSEHHQAHASVWPVRHTCDAKELTHNGVSGGVPSLPEWHWMVAPSGIDAKDWYSDRFTSCENNCIVKNKREFLEPGDGVSSDLRSVTENDGTSRSMFTKRQTGEVCVVEKQKPDDPPKPPAPDTDNGTGNGQSGAGSDSGDGQGQGNGQGGEGSQNGSDSQNNQGSGNSDDSGSGSGGSGSGSGGVNGSGGQTGPSGGGTSGGESGGNESSGSEGEAGGESDGSGEESGGSGDSGGQGGADSGGQGNVGGTGEGQGSISGGSCELNQAPDCKGDPIQCYIAREQWRTACATLGNKGNISGGDCTSLTPPKCEGDATQCYIAKQQFVAGCEAQAQREARDGLKGYADGKSGVISDVEGASEDGVNNALEANSGQFDMTNIFDLSGFGLTRGCPAPRVVEMGDFGQVEFDTGMFCTFAQILGNIFVGLTMLWALRYVFA